MSQWTNTTTYIQQLNTMLPGLGQFAFPASQNASSDPNTLDDYERGTFTPSLGGSATYTTQAGRYVKIGRVVNVWITIVVNVLGTGSTTIISGLPFTSVNSGQNQSGSVGYFAALAANVIYIVSNVLSNSATISFNSINASGAGISLTTAIFGNSAGVVLHNTYESAA